MDEMTPLCEKCGHESSLHLNGWDCRAHDDVFNGCCDCRRVQDGMEIVYPYCDPNPVRYEALALGVLRKYSRFTPYIGDAGDETN